MRLKHVNESRDNDQIREFYDGYNGFNGYNVDTVDSDGIVGDSDANDEGVDRNQNSYSYKPSTDFVLVHSLYSTAAASASFLEVDASFFSLPFTSIQKTD